MTDEKTRHPWLARIMVLVGILVQPTVGAAEGDAPAVETWRFEARDGVELFAEYRPSEVASEAPLLVLFHQAGGDGRGEYGPIVPRLLELGYSTLAVDLRSGGDRFESVNRTVEAQGGREWSYCEAEADVDATLDEITRRAVGTGGVALWGSSYSAALVARVGSRRSGEVAAILAFSPATGGPMEACSPDEVWQDLEPPAVVFRPTAELEYPPVAEQWKQLEAAGVPRVVEPGRHGSSLLVAERGSEGAGAAWQELEAFLSAHLPTPRGLFLVDFSNAWRAGSAEGLAALWLEDGDWMGLLGSRRVARGRSAVAGVWSIGLSGRETQEQRALEIEVDGERHLAAGLRFMDLVMTFGTPSTGWIREAMVATVQRQGARWRISSARVARLSSQPAPDAE